MITRTRYGELRLSLLTYMTRRKTTTTKNKQKKKNKNKETKTVRGELLLLETAGHKALKKTEK